MSCSFDIDVMVLKEYDGTAVLREQSKAGIWDAQ